MNTIEEFYDNKTQYEWDRLERHRTEFAVTMRALQEYAPQPPAAILDIGGGPGRYAIALAQRGYTVTLVDLSQGNLALARLKAQEAGVELAGYVHANAMNIEQFPAECCDALLLLGPMYHLLTARERQQALHKADRVLRSGGVILVSFITRYAVIRWAAKNQPDWIMAHRQLVEGLLATGALTAAEGGGFTDAYYAHPSEIKPLMEQSGFETVNLIACEGVVSMIEEQVNTLTGELWQAWVELNYRLGQDPALHSAVEHLLYVGKKPRA